MESEDFSKYWEMVLTDWDGSTKDTFSSSQSKVLTHPIQLPSFVVSDLSVDEIAKEDSKELTAIDYKVIERIASGGMGAVFKGYQESLDREVAIKKLLAHIKEPYVKERFVAESKITAHLDHPNIVPVYEIGLNEEQEIMLTMKLVGGNSWKKLLRNDKDDLEKHLQILLNVMNAIAFAHSKNIVHNDLKPDNVMVGEFGEVLVMDWGLALDICKENPQKPSFPHYSTVKGPLGTPGYMAPELAKGESELIGPGTDIYLLGAILYEILMGTPPHQGTEVKQIIQSIVDGDPLEWDSKIPEELQKICSKAMAREIKDRYQSVAEFRSEIESFLQHRQSIAIAESAQKILKNCKLKVRNSFISMSQLDRHSLYDDFALAISSFYQAIELWPENTKAIEGEKQARFEYAKVAIESLDFGLAQAQLKKLDPQNEEIIKLQKQIDNAGELQECSILSQKLMALGIITAAAISFRLLLSVVLPPQDKLYFMQNNPASLTVCILILVASVLWVQILRYKSFSSLKSLLYFAALYEAIGVALIAFMFAAAHFGPTAVPTGIFPSAAIILLFRVIIPYPVKLSLLVGLTTASIAVVTLFLAKYFLNMPLPPELLIIPYIVEHYMIAMIGVLISKILK